MITRIIALCSLLTGNLFAQCSDYYWLNPSPQGNDINEVFVSPEGRIHHAADRGIWFTSSDTNQTYQVAQALSGYNLTSVYFPSSFTGYCGAEIGTAGEIYKTTDGGINWSVVYSGSLGSYGPIYSLHFFNDSVGLAGGTGRIFRTADGGQNWNLVYTAASGFAGEDFYFFDQDTGYAVGGHTIIKTVNGGLSWTLVNTQPNDFLYAVSFATRDTGYVTTSTSNKLFYTYNGGATWTANSNPGIFNGVNEIVFTTPDTGFLVTQTSVNYGRVYRTINRGVSWQEVFSTFSLNLAIDLNSIAFTDPMHGTAGGNLGLLLSTNDGGSNWIVESEGLNYSPRTSFFINDSTGIFASAGEVLRTTDYGNTFTVINLPATSQANCIYFPSPDTGYIAGNNGMRIRTIDGGLTWTVLMNSGGLINDVFFTDNNTGYFCGLNGAIIKTTNAGGNFTGLSSGTSSTLYGIYFLNADTGFACGADGTIIRTYDAGQTWTTLNSGSTLFIKRIQFLDAMHGFAGGEDSKFWRTNDGGDTWTFYQAGFGDDMYDFVMLDSLNGYFVTGGFNGIVYRTIDGGSSFQGMVSLNNGYLYDICIPNRDSLYICGSTSSIWRVSPALTEPHIAGIVQRCGNDSVVWPGDQTGIVYEWFHQPIGGTMIGSGNTIIYTSQNAIDTIYVRQSNAGINCVAPRRPVIINSLNVPAVPIITASNTTPCYGDTIQLVASLNDSLLWNNSETSMQVFSVYQNGYYAAMAYNGICMSELSDSVFIQFPSAQILPLIVPIGTDSLQCQTTGIMYNWFLDGVLLSDTGSIIPISGIGDYTVMLTDSNGCESLISIPYNVLPNGLTAKDSFPDLAKPNPFCNELFLSDALTIMNYKIFSADGRLWLEGNPGNNSRIQTTLLPIGVYFLTCTRSNGLVQSTKLIKTKP